MTLPTRLTTVVHRILRWGYQHVFHRDDLDEVLCESVSIPTRDDQRMVANHYYPRCSRNTPTLLMRTPYGRNGLISFPYAYVYAACGYHVVVASVRGTAGSTGQFHPVKWEHDDGVDTLEWIVHQPWCHGQVIVMGMSYVGLTGWALLDSHSPHIGGGILIAAPHDLPASLWSTGAVNIHDLFTWTYLMECLSSSNPLMRWAGGLLSPWGLSQLRGQYGLSQRWPARIVNNSCWYVSWLTHPDLHDSFWNQYRCGSTLRNSDVPLMLITGWQDVFLEQTLHQYHQLVSRNQPVWLVIGPWTHASMGLGPSRKLTDYTLRWLAHYNETFTRSHDAKHQCDHSPQTPRSVEMFISRDRWYRFANFPAIEPLHSYWLESSQRLSDQAPIRMTQVEFSHTRPYRSYRGGRVLGIGGGRHYRWAYPRGEDLLHFTSPPLESDLWIIGSSYVYLDHQASVYPADVWVQVRYVSQWRLCHELTQGYRRLTEPTHGVRIDLDPIGYRLRAGERIQILIRAAQWPHYYPTTQPCHHRITLGVSRLVMPARTTPPPWS